MTIYLWPYTPRVLFFTKTPWAFSNRVNAQFLKLLFKIMQSHSSYSLIDTNDGRLVSPCSCAPQMSESHSRILPVMFATFFSLVTVLNRSIFSHHARVIRQASALPQCHLSAWHILLQSMCCVSYLPGCFRVWMGAEGEGISRIQKTWRSLMNWN